MDENALAQYIVETFPNVESSDNFGYKFFFFGDDHRLPFATIAASDNEYESISQLDRPGVFRLNIGVSKQTFQARFGSGEISTSDYDFAELDRIMPHPNYYKQFFVCVLNPSEANLPTVKGMLAEAHAIAERRYQKRSQAE